MSRLEFGEKVKKAAITRAAGKCEKCAMPLKAGEAEIDHILPCGLGGKNELVNAMVLCRVCHAEKTAVDVGRMRKADRAGWKQKGNKRQTALSSPKVPKPPLTKTLPPKPLYRSIEQ
jgi:5-methylcytosine-specific restriction endonuclease McrA